MSVAEIANTLISVLDGTTENQFGQEIDANVPTYEHVPAFLAETGRSVQDPSTPMPRTIREVTCQVPLWLGIRRTARILDEPTGDIFMIMSVTTPPRLNGAPVDSVLSLKRVTASGP